MAAHARKILRHRCTHVSHAFPLMLQDYNDSTLFNAYPSPTLLPIIYSVTALENVFVELRWEQRVLVST
jgi:hypothetical protein